jgi:hypothetical protein
VTAVRAGVEKAFKMVQVIVHGTVVRGQLEVQAKPLHGQPHEAGDQVAHDDARWPREQDDQEDP